MTVELRVAGTRNVTVQGDEYGTVYAGDGTQGYLRGDSVTGVYYKGNQYITEDGERITAIGNSAGTLFKGNGGWIRGRGTQISGLRHPGSETVTVQGALFTGNLHRDNGEQFTVQGDAYDGDLFTPGTYHKNGLYTNFEEATIETQDVTVMTV